MPVSAEAFGVTDLVARFERVMSAIRLDCDCESTLKRALTRFAALERTRETRKALAIAGEHKDQIIARIAFLAELDELNEHEADWSVYNEMALLFDEIASAGEAAASTLRVAARTRSVTLSRR
ncbi:MAG: hypothetical protein KIS96_00200 [Bauldia sp.]|nr:hypothetical protein [Bauldia sp.]